MRALEKSVAWRSKWRKIPWMKEIRTKWPKGTTYVESTPLEGKRTERRWMKWINQKQYLIKSIWLWFMRSQSCFPRLSPRLGLHHANGELAGDSGSDSLPSTRYVTGLTHAREPLLPLCIPWFLVSSPPALLSPSSSLHSVNLASPCVIEPLHLRLYVCM